MFFFHTLSKLYDVPVGFVSPSFEAVYCYICGRQRMAFDIGWFVLFFHFSWTFRIIPYLCEIDVRIPTSFWSSEKVIKFKPGVKTCIDCSRMNYSSIIWYPWLYRINTMFSKNGDWKLGHMSYLPVVAPLPKWG